MVKRRKGKRGIKLGKGMTNINKRMEPGKYYREPKQKLSRFVLKKDLYFEWTTKVG